MRRTRFHKQIRKKLLDTEPEIFVICPPGFEEECTKEIQSLSPHALFPAREKGGILIQAPLSLIPELNVRLRTASRILMRLGHFTAREFHHLEKAAEAIPWHLYFPKGPCPEIRVSCQHCRLYHTDAIALRIQKILEVHLAKSDGMEARPDMPMPALFIRGEQDCFTLSIDSSGPHLHFRGLKTQGGKAPLRETLAAAVLMASGYRADHCLVDPMCGSGTFSMEAALIASATAPGTFRSFAWENWPAFLLHNKKEEAHTDFPSLSHAPILASDIDQNSILTFQKQCGIHPVLQKITVRQADFFSLNPPATDPGLIVLNPPYGLRMQKKQDADMLALSIHKRLSQKWKNWHTGLIFPENSAFIPLPGFQRRRFLHGGLVMHLFTGSIP